MERYKILMVEDSKDYIHTIKKKIRDLYSEEEIEIQFLQATNKQGALKLLEENKDIAVLFLDVVMEEEDTGLQIAKAVRNELKNQDIRIIILTGEAKKDEEEIVKNYVIDAFKNKNGLYDESLKTLISTNLNDYKKSKTLSDELNKEKAASKIQRKKNTWTDFKDFIGESKAAKKIRNELIKLAKDPTGAPVLITGERGTGKEVVASILHFNSDYVTNKSVFITQNTGALHFDSLDSILFGHMHGAFTSTVADRKGCFRAAENGTLFLDEIGNVEKNAQKKLLRAIEYNKITPLGSDKELSVNARLILATNKDIWKLAEEGKFMPDLIDRIDRRRIHLPPLRERKADIPVFTHFFVNLYSEIYNLQFVPEIDQEVFQKLSEYNYPGNVRELQDIIENAIFEIYHADERKLTVRHIVFNDEKSTFERGQIKSKLKYGNNYEENIELITIDFLEKHRSLWENKPTQDITPLINIDNIPLLIAKIVHQGTFNNLTKTAKLLSTTVNKKPVRDL